MIFSKFYSVLVRYLAVLYSSCAGHISLKGEIVLGKRSRVDHFAPKVLGNEGLVLVGGDDQVREGECLQSSHKSPTARHIFISDTISAPCRSVTDEARPCYPHNVFIVHWSLELLLLL